MTLGPVDDARTENAMDDVTGTRVEIDFEDTLLEEAPVGERARAKRGSPARSPVRRRFVLEDTGFNEVPKPYRKFYRKWGGPSDVLAPNEVLCPVCKVVIRSIHELRPGDRVYCMPCMSRLVVARDANGMLIGNTAY